MLNRKHVYRKKDGSYIVTRFKIKRHQYIGSLKHLMRKLESLEIAVGYLQGKMDANGTADLLNQLYISDDGD